jgi:hypothetical protein
VKKRDFTNWRKLHAINGQSGLEHLQKYVLTAKRGLFLGVLAGKQGFRAGKKAFYFALFHVFVVFFFRKLLSVRIFRNMCGSKKIVPENLPKVYCFSGVMT